MNNKELTPLLANLSLEVRQYFLYLVSVPFMFAYMDVIERASNEN